MTKQANHRGKTRPKRPASHKPNGPRSLVFDLPLPPPGTELYPGELRMPDARSRDWLSSAVSDRVAVDPFQGLAALHQGSVVVTLFVCPDEACDLTWTWDRLQYAIGLQEVVGLSLRRDNRVRPGRARVELAPA